MSGSALAFACVLLAACSPATTGLGEGSSDEAAGTAATETADDDVGSDTDGSTESAGDGSTETADETTTDAGESTTDADESTTDEGESTTDAGDTTTTDGGDTTTTDGGTDTTDGGTDTTTDGGTDTTDTETSSDDGMMVECGNDILEPGEECDGPELNAEDCYSLGFLNGSLACGENCEFDLSTCYAGDEGDPCAGDDNCKDYCKSGQCWDGSEGDPCDEFQGHCNSGICWFGNCT